MEKTCFNEILILFWSVPLIEIEIQIDVEKGEKWMKKEDRKNRQRVGIQK